MRNFSPLIELTLAQLKLQHERSVLGVLWYILGPLLLFAVLLTVFSQRLGSGIEHYPLYLLLGIILWNFFATATGRSIVVLQQHAGLIKALPVRCELFVLAVVLTTLVSHCIELLIFLGVLLWFGIVPTGVFLFLPTLGLHVMFTLGAAFLLSGLFVHLRDVGQIWSIVTRTWWFATPIFYALDDVKIVEVFNRFNPLYYSISASRSFLIYQESVSLQHHLTLVFFAGTSLCIGYVCFRFLTRNAADLL